jgi:hypothetical protein
MGAAKIHHDGRYVMSEGIEGDGVKCSMVGDEERSGQPSVVNYNDVRNAGQKNFERLRFSISLILCEFAQISRTVINKIITVAISRSAHGGFRKYSLVHTKHKGRHRL